MGGMSAMPAIVSDFAALQRRKCSVRSGLYVKGKRPSRRVELAGRVVPQNHFWEGTMKLPRRKFLHLAAGAAALPVISRVASAQAFPARPITMIVPIAAGSASDVGGAPCGRAK